MTRSLVSRPPGTTPEQAKDVLHQMKVEKLILVDTAGRIDKFERKYSAMRGTNKVPATK